jgi:ATP-dependent DNA helicase RecQ
MTAPFQPFLQRCVSVDLEVDPATASIFAFAAVRDDARPSILAKKRDLDAALDRLEAESAAAEHLLGHNIIRHDLPHLVALRPVSRIFFHRRSTPYGSIRSHFRAIPTTT